ncbi:intracellular serine protease [Colletotrichum kahawae]|uniref:Intracellular serine protease n=1 Tax=Colletotrichum kahawae TaxID=34407 RepID=A0AAE0CYD7_COLKA|nr:intracellular serine protease [Colletotrichum kahawae]
MESEPITEAWSDTDHPPVSPVPSIPLDKMSRVQQTATRKSKGVVHIVGSMAASDPRNGLNNAAVWALEEDPKTEGGLPASVRFGILLKRPFDKRDDAFQCKVKVNAKFDLRTRMEKAFSSRNEEDPILFLPSEKPTNNLMTYYTVNLGDFDLSIVEKVTFDM